MSTRATYSFVNGTTRTFYCHWDGYPAWAARRFRNALTASFPKELLGTDPGPRAWHNITDRPRGGFAFAFIRGNEDAEPSSGHDAHGDTEYRYTYREKTGTIEVFSRNPAWEWKADGKLHLADFISRECADEPDPLEWVGLHVEPARYGGGDDTFCAPVKIARTLAALADAYAATFTDGNPNKLNYAQLANNWRRVEIDARNRFNAVHERERGAA